MTPTFSTTPSCAENSAVAPSAVLEGATGGDVSADPLPDEAFGALGARGEVDVGDDRRLRGGERERGEEEESGVGDARHGGEKWRRVLRKVAAGARAFRSGTFSEVF